METKLNAGARACYHRALPDEPMFVLLARDPAAPKAIEAWVKERVTLRRDDDSEDSLLDALKDAERFKEWRAANEGRWHTEVPPDADLIPTPSDEVSSTAGWFMGHQMAKGLTVSELADAERGSLWVSLGYAQELLEKGRSLAGFALRSDTVKGSNDA